MSFDAITKKEAGMLRRFLPFWLFLMIYKFAMCLHYDLIPVLGERVMPLWAVGILLGGESFLQLILDLPAGRMVDRFGALRVLAFATPIFFLSALLLAVPLSAPVLIASVTLSIFGWIFLGPGVNAYILTHAKKDSSGAFISLRDSFFSGGVVLASLVLPFVIPMTPVYIGLTLAIIAAVGITMLHFTPKDKAVPHADPEHETTSVAPEQKGSGQSWKEILAAFKKFGPVGVTLALLQTSGAIFYGAIWFVVPLAIASQPNNGILSVGLGIFDFSVVALGFILGTLVDRGNKRLMVFFGLLLFAIAGALCGTNFGPLFLLFGFLATAGDEAANLSLWSWLHSMDKEHTHDGAISGILSLTEDAGWVIGPVIAGVLYGIVGPAWTITLAAVPILCTWVVYLCISHILPTPSFHGVPSMRLKAHRRRHSRDRR